MTVGAVSVGRHKTHQNKTQTCKPGDVVIDDADIFLEEDTRNVVRNKHSGIEETI